MLMAVAGIVVARLPGGGLLFLLMRQRDQPAG
jgi:hypothetical protein